MKTDPTKLKAWRERSKPLSARKPMPARRSFKAIAAAIHNAISKERAA